MFERQFLDRSYYLAQCRNSWRNSCRNSAKSVLPPNRCMRNYRGLYWFDRHIELIMNYFPLLTNPQTLDCLQFLNCFYYELLSTLVSSPFPLLLSSLHHCSTALSNVFSTIILHTEPAFQTAYQTANQTGAGWKSKLNFIWILLIEAAVSQAGITPRRFVRFWSAIGHANLPLPTP